MLNIFFFLYIYLDLPRDALQQFQKALRVDETHQMALVGVCRTLRKLGQHSRLHQAVLRQVEIIFFFLSISFILVATINNGFLEEKLL